MEGALREDETLSFDMMKTIAGMWRVIAVAAVICLGSGIASAQTLAPQERLCDPTFQDCRADILTYIQQETVEIDMGFWMMTDARYANALVAAWQRGVKIRLLMDPRCDDAARALQPAERPAAGRRASRCATALTSGILHWKMHDLRRPGADRVRRRQLRAVRVRRPTRRT